MELNVEEGGKFAFIDTLFTKSVPHLIEKIFLSLDYTTYKNCLKVKDTWNEVLTSESFLKRAKSLFKKEILEDELNLQHASRKGKAEEVRRLISSGFLDVNCLLCLTKSRNESSMRGMRSTPLCLAAQGGHKEVVQILLDRGAEYNKTDTDGYTPLHIAVRFGHKDVLKMLLEKGADTKIPDKLINYSPLHTAARFNYLEVAKLLLEGGANVNKKDLFGQIPLYCAAICGHTDLASLLLDAGSDPNTTNVTGWTPLHRAAKEGYNDMAKTLLDNDAEVDKVNSDWNERTALHYASHFGHASMVKILLDRGANCEKKDALGLTPMRMAKYKDNQDVVKLLQDRLATQ